MADNKLEKIVSWAKRRGFISIFIIILAVVALFFIIDNPVHTKETETWKTTKITSADAFSFGGPILGIYSEVVDFFQKYMIYKNKKYSLRIFYPARFVKISTYDNSLTSDFDTIQIFSRFNKFAHIDMFFVTLTDSDANLTLDQFADKAISGIKNKKTNIKKDKLEINVENGILKAGGKELKLSSNNVLLLNYSGSFLIIDQTNLAAIDPSLQKAINSFYDDMIISGGRVVESQKLGYSFLVFGFTGGTSGSYGGSGSYEETFHGSSGQTLSIIVQKPRTENDTLAAPSDLASSKKTEMTLGTNKYICYGDISCVTFANSFRYEIRVSDSSLRPQLMGSLRSLKLFKPQLDANSEIYLKEVNFPVDSLDCVSKGNCRMSLKGRNYLIVLSDSWKGYNFNMIDDPNKKHYKTDIFLSGIKVLTIHEIYVQDWANAFENNHGFIKAGENYNYVIAYEKGQISSEMASRLNIDDLMKKIIIAQ